MVSLASEPVQPKNTFDMPGGASPINRSASSAGVSVPIDENAW